ncbi:MAG TPA: shikimate dehydrogenase [Hyphomicrobiaceae bacterium]|jgi:shikimate dehydrogenase|nr:shikimate dehydrogenase [Hyphomicrobiaceae bacterium]
MSKACIIGWPVAHSRSPIIHGYWLRTYAISGSYGRQPVRPGEVGQFLASMPALGLAGCNVTLPHKEAAFAAAARKLPGARAVGAANTLWYEDGVLACDNTDGAGFMSHLAASAPGFKARDCGVASILGAGGAARAIVHAFLSAGVHEVRLFNRTRARADELAAFFGPRVQAYDWSRAMACSVDAGILVNATTLGMQGGGGRLEFDVAALNVSCVVADLVYVPLLTPLLAAAKARGLTTVDGLGMLMHQAVPGFEKWFGVRPQVTRELRELLVADLGRS